jgi:hypothetical protein
MLNFRGTPLGTAYEYPGVGMVGMGILRAKGVLWRWLRVTTKNLERHNRVTQIKE